MLAVEWVAPKVDVGGLLFCIAAHPLSFDLEPEMSNANMPGHYHADGDPAGTVRYWDGSQWVGDPIPAPPGSIDAPPPPPGGGIDDRYAGVGVRVGALVIDMVINIVVSLVLVAALTEDNTYNAGFVQSAIITVIAFGVYVVLIGQFGGSPGKLMLGLRITTADGTTPPGYPLAVRRSAPYLLSIIPIFGALAVLIMLVVSILYISRDPLCRSVFDRVADSRVVHLSKT